LSSLSLSPTFLPSPPLNRWFPLPAPHAGVAQGNGAGKFRPPFFPKDSTAATRAQCGLLIEITPHLSTPLFFDSFPHRSFRRFSSSFLERILHTGGLLTGSPLSYFKSFFWAPPPPPFFFFFFFLFPSRCVTTMDFFICAVRLVIAFSLSIEWAHFFLSLNILFPLLPEKRVFFLPLPSLQRFQGCSMGFRVPLYVLVMSKPIRHPRLDSLCRILF